MADCPIRPASVQTPGTPRAWEYRRLLIPR